jgi:hypothetical protein
MGDTMNDLNVGAIVSAVQKNCHISDAQFAGDLTLCTFLLKMRELYRWEHDIPLTQDMPKSEVGDWMNERERCGRGWKPRLRALAAARRGVDPFEVASPTANWRPMDWSIPAATAAPASPISSSATGCGRKCARASRSIVSGCEFARDLDAPPGMLLDSTIFVRTESLRAGLWEKIRGMALEQAQRGHGPGGGCYGFEQDPEAALEA